MNMWSNCDLSKIKIKTKTLFFQIPNLCLAQLHHITVFRNVFVTSSVLCCEVKSGGVFFIIVSLLTSNRSMYKILYKYLLNKGVHFTVVISTLVFLTEHVKVSIFHLPGNPSTLLIILLVLRTLFPWAKPVSFPFSLMHLWGKQWPDVNLEFFSLCFCLWSLYTWGVTMISQ